MSALHGLLTRLEVHRAYVASMTATGSSFLTVDFRGRRNSGYVPEPVQLRLLADLGLVVGAECFP